MSKHRAPATPKQASSMPPLLQELLWLCLKLAVIAGVLWGLFTFLFGLHRNLDPGMRPAFQEGDLVLYYRLDKHYEPQDTLLLQYEGETQIRRVVATAGDVVDITEAGLLVNGALQQEKTIYEETLPYEEGIVFPVTIPEGSVFVLGDSRKTAGDSRIYGAVKISETQGKVISLFRRRSI